MKKSITTLLLLCVFNSFSQDYFDDIEEIPKDTIVYQKDTEISKERTFSKNLNEVYTGKDFQYKEQIPKPKSKPVNTGFVDFLIFFMSKVFPFLLGGFVIFVLLKVLFGFDFRFWKQTKKAKKLTEKLIYEDDDIHEVNLEELLNNALQQKDFRLAIRYYYLTVLKGLSSKKLIDYHKDKTNSEYLFEIENKDIRNQFSYLSYVYSYVWYGEFFVDENSFKLAENKYQSFLKSIV